MSTSLQTLIVPADTTDDDILALSESLGVSSVCRGIPPRLADVISEDDLPTVYTETATDVTSDSGAACEDREVSFDDSEVATVFSDMMEAHAATGGSSSGESR